MTLAESYGGPRPHARALSSVKVLQLWKLAKTLIKPDSPLHPGCRVLGLRSLGV